MKNIVAILLEIAQLVREIIGLTLFPPQPDCPYENRFNKN